MGLLEELFPDTVVDGEFSDLKNNSVKPSDIYQQFSSSISNPSTSPLAKSLRSFSPRAIKTKARASSFLSSVSSSSNSASASCSSAPSNSCFKVAIIGDEEVPMEDLIGLIKKASKNSLSSSRVSGMMESSTYVSPYRSTSLKSCNCNSVLPDAFRDEYNVDTRTTIIQYQNVEYYLHISKVSLKDQLFNLSYLIADLETYDAFILSYSLSVKLTFEKMQPLIEAISFKSFETRPVMLVGIYGDSSLRLHSLSLNHNNPPPRSKSMSGSELSRERKVSYLSGLELADLYKLVFVELDFSSSSQSCYNKIFKFAWRTLFNRVMRVRETSVISGIDSNLKRYFNIIVSTSNSAEHFDISNCVESSAASNNSSPSSNLVFPSPEIPRSALRSSKSSLQSMLLTDEGFSGAASNHSDSGKSSCKSLSAKSQKFLAFMFKYVMESKDFDVHVAKSLFAIYPKYVDSKDMLERILMEFRSLESELAASSSEGESSKGSPEKSYRCTLPQIRLLNSISLWIKCFPVDFNQEMIDLLGEFAQSNFANAKSKEVFGRLQRIIQSIAAKQEVSEVDSVKEADASSLKSETTNSVESLSMYNSGNSNIFSRLMSKIMKQPTDIDLASLDISQIRFEDLDSVSIANQLTLMEWKVFNAIELREVMNLALGLKPTTPVSKTSPLNEHFKHFNFIAGWTASIILKNHDPATRVNAILKFARIGQELLKLNNFGTLMAVLGGINCPSVVRLKETQQMLKKRKKEYEALENLCKLHSPSRSFVNYRTALRKIESAPAIPYLGVITHDLLKINEGNPDFRDEGFNIPKLKLLSDVIEPWHRYKCMKVMAELPKIEKLQLWIKSQLVYTDKELHLISKMRDKTES